MGLQSASGLAAIREVLSLPHGAVQVSAILQVFKRVKKSAWLSQLQENSFIAVKGHFFT